MKLYHGTSEMNGWRILNEGILTRAQSRINPTFEIENMNNFIYLTSNHPSFYGWKRASLDSCSRVSIFEIDSDLLDSNKFGLCERDLEYLMRDRDFLPKAMSLSERMKYYQKVLNTETITTNLDILTSFSGNVCYKDRISRNAITKMAFVDIKTCTPFSFQFAEPDVSIVNYSVVKFNYTQLTKWIFKEIPIMIFKPWENYHKLFEYDKSQIQIIKFDNHHLNKFENLKNSVMIQN